MIRILEPLFHMLINDGMQNIYTRVCICYFSQHKYHDVLEVCCTTLKKYTKTKQWMPMSVE